MKKKALLQAKDPKLAKKYKQSAKQIEVNKKNAYGPTIIIRRKFDCDVWSEGGKVVQFVGSYGITVVLLTCLKSFFWFTSYCL